MAARFKYSWLRPDCSAPYVRQSLEIVPESQNALVCKVGIPQAAAAACVTGDVSSSSEPNKIFTSFFNNLRSIGANCKKKRKLHFRLTASKRKTRRGRRFKRRLTLKNLTSRKHLTKPKNPVKGEIRLVFKKFFLSICTW